MEPRSGDFASGDCEGLLEALHDFGESGLGNVVHLKPEAECDTRKSGSTSAKPAGAVSLS